MAISIIFGGTQLYVPGAYDTKNVILTGAQVSVAVGKVAIIGESTNGAPSLNAQGITQWSPQAITQLIAMYGSGPIVDAARQLVDPSNDKRITNGASAIYVYKTNPSTQASLTLPNGLVVTSDQYGTDQNLISFQLLKSPAIEATVTSSGVAPSFAVSSIAAGDQFAMRENGGQSIQWTAPAGLTTRAALQAALNLPSNWSPAAPQTVSFAVSGLSDAAAILTISQNPQANDSSLGYARDFELIDGNGLPLTAMNIAGMPDALFVGLEQESVRVITQDASSNINEDSNNSVGNIGGQVYLEVGYQTTLTASLTITETNLIAVVSGGIGSSMNLKLGNFTTLNALAAYINSQPGYSASVPAGISGGLNPSVLDEVASMGIAATGTGIEPGQIKADYFQLFNYIQNNSQLVSIPAAESDGSPIAATFVGTIPGSSFSPSAFALLAASAITNTGSSVINGNVGVAPGTSITPGGWTLNGSSHSDDSTAIAAQAAAHSSFTTMNALTPTPIPSILDGQTLTPGVYSEASGTFNLAASGPGTLTLNGAGTYVFQCSSTLVTGSGGTPTITLTGGATAANIYWIVGSSATINSGHAGVFEGNIIAQASITDTSGGTVNGSFAALSGAITLSAATTINYPSSLPASSVTLTAVTPGPAGNAIELSFDGSTSINNEIIAWNTANPSNTVVLSAGDGTQIPDAGADAQFSGGNNSSIVGLPANMPTALFLSGGSQGGSSSSDFTAGLDALENVDDVSIIVPLVSQDASNDILEDPTYTDPSSTYQVEPILIATLTNCLTMSQTQNRKERVCYLGYRGTFPACQSMSLSLNSGYASLLIQDVEVVNQQNNLVFLQPHIAACLAAGMQAGADIGQPTTHKDIQATAIRHVGQAGVPLTGQNLFNPKSDLNMAIANGIFPLTNPSSGGVEIVVQNATYSTDNNFVYNRPSVLSAINYMAQVIRSTLEDIFVGEKLVTGTTNAVEAEIVALCASFLQSQILVGDDTNDGLGFKNLVVDAQGDAIYFDITLTPVQGVDFILENLFIDNIHISSGVSTGSAAA